MRTPAKRLDLLAGTSLRINGPLPPEAQDLGALSYESAPGGLRLTFAEMQPGFWLGGKLWRGELSAPAGIPGGTYTLTLRLDHGQGCRPLYDMQVAVYSDRVSLRRSSESLVLRYLGWQPFRLAAGLVPGILATFLLVYLLSRRCDRLLAQMGRAEIYRWRQTEAGMEVAFGLGSRHGIRPGSILRILDDQGKTIGSVEVEVVSDADAVGRAACSVPMRAGCVVSE